MNRIRNILLIISLIAVAFFIIVVFTVKSDAEIWRAFSITMPIIGISFCGVVILTAIGWLKKK